MTVDTLSLAGKVAIVTGSGRENGIGAAIAIALARNGAAVTITHVSDASAERAATVAKKIQSDGGKATVVKAALDQAGGAEYLVQETMKAFGTDHIDILVNNAGVIHLGMSLHMTKEQLEETFSANVYGAVYATQAVVPHMPRGGRIINISSIAAKLGPIAMAFYGASKAALDSLTYAWAAEFGQSRGITVNSIAPGLVQTDMVPYYNMTEQIAHLIEMTRAEHRLGTPNEVADAVLLLTSEKSGWITGQHISASGGITGI